jgi:hypothetical protein
MIHNTSTFNCSLPAPCTLSSNTNASPRVLAGGGGVVLLRLAHVPYVLLPHAAAPLPVASLLLCSLWADSLSAPHPRRSRRDEEGRTWAPAWSTCAAAVQSRVPHFFPLLSFDRIFQNIKG